MIRLLTIAVLIIQVINISAQSEKSIQTDAIKSLVPQQQLSPETGAPKSIINDSTFYIHNSCSWGYGYYPVRYGLGGYWWGTPWRLHKGLNVSIDASVFGFFGKNTPKGAGFGQTITALYALPVTNHLTFIGGGYFNNTYFSHNNYREGGFYGELTYRFDEHWETSIYGQKSIMNNAAGCWMPGSLFMSERIGDRIGGSVRYNFSPAFSVQLNVEYQSLPGRNDERPIMKDEGLFH